MYRLCADEAVRKLWLRETQAEEKSKSTFIMPYRMTNKTRPAVNLAERRLLSDMVGDYLRAYDDTVTDVDAVRQILVNRPESKRLGGYLDLLSDDVLKRVMERREMEGDAVLLGDHDEH